MKFKQAKKAQSSLRMALLGPSGSGKTFTALTIAKALGERVAVIDTERGSASKYAGDVATFDVLELESFSPDTYVEAIEAAAKEGYTVLVIDSLSHAWMGKDGALEQVDKVSAKSRSGNSFAAWREVTPMHNALVDAILRYPGHVLVTMRQKTEWVLEEDDRGKKVPKRVGMAPVQRDGMEYEFDVVGDMDHAHSLVVSKSRCPALADAVIRKPDGKVAEALKAWLDDGYDPLAETIAALEAATTPVQFAAAKEAARRVFRTVTNGRRASLEAAVKAALARCVPMDDAPPAESIAAAVTQAETPKSEQLSDQQDELQLAAWIRKRRKGLRTKPEMLAQVAEHADRIGIGDAVAWVDRQLAEVAA